MDHWASQVEQQISDLVGDEIADSVRSRWAEHAGREHVEVTLFGPFDSGKSSLLKRLLHEAGVETPDWLTVNARRETWKTNEVDADGITFTDTPGIAAGDAEHERMATETITLTDALLVIMPPQLLTSEKDLVLDVLSGRFFGPASGWAFPPGALRVVISRADEGGFDPVESPDAFRSFAHSKQTELLALLRASGVNTPIDATCAIPDPYGLVGNRTGAAYQDIGDVDGIGELVGELRLLRERKDPLRSAARVRYLLHAGSWIATRVERHLDELALRASELQRRVDEQRTVGSEVEPLLAAARANLGAVLNDEAQAVAERQISAEQVDEKLRERVYARVMTWRETWDIQLGELAERLAERYDAEQRRPMSALLDRLFEAPDSTEESSRVTQAWDLLTRSGPVLEEAARQAIKTSLGMTLEDAQKELRRLEKLSPEDRAKAFADGKSGFGSERSYEQMGKVVKAAVVVVEFGPIVAMLMRELQSGDDSDGEIARRAALTERAREASAEIAREIIDGPDGWAEGPRSLLQATSAAKDLLVRSLEGLDSETKRHRHGLDALRELLQGAPTSVGTAPPSA